MTKALLHGSCPAIVARAPEVHLSTANSRCKLFLRSLPKREQAVPEPPYSGSQLVRSSTVRAL